MTNGSASLSAERSSVASVSSIATSTNARAKSLMRVARRGSAIMVSGTALAASLTAVSGASSSLRITTVRCASNVVPSPVRRCPFPNAARPRCAAVRCGAGCRRRRGARRRARAPRPSIRSSPGSTSPTRAGGRSAASRRPRAGSAPRTRFRPPTLCAMPRIPRAPIDGCAGGWSFESPVQRVSSPTSRRCCGPRATPSSRMMPSLSTSSLSARYL